MAVGGREPEDAMPLMAQQRQISAAPAPRQLSHTPRRDSVQRLLAIQVDPAMTSRNTRKTVVIPTSARLHWHHALECHQSVGPQLRVATCLNRFTFDALCQVWRIVSR